MRKGLCSVYLRLLSAVAAWEIGLESWNSIGPQFGVAARLKRKFITYRMLRIQSSAREVWWWHALGWTGPRRHWRI